VLAERTGERFFEAELHRLQGMLLLTSAGSNEPTRVEDCFRRALAVARRQDAKSLELRALIGLCRLHETQGGQAEVKRMLEESYGWFTEGFESNELQEAKKALEGLQEGPAAPGG
jgi:adenylate cyclase